MDTTISCLFNPQKPVVKSWIYPLPLTTGLIFSNGWSWRYISQGGTHPLCLYLQGKKTQPLNESRSRLQMLESYSSSAGKSLAINNVLVVDLFTPSSWKPTYERHLRMPATNQDYPDYPDYPPWNEQQVCTWELLAFLHKNLGIFFTPLNLCRKITSSLAPKSLPLWFLNVEGAVPKVCLLMNFHRLFEPRNLQTSAGSPWKSQISPVLPLPPVPC